MDVTWVLPAAKEAYKERQAITSAWARLINLLLGSRRRICFTGMAGVGKTVLFDYLTGVAYKRNYKLPKQSQAAERKALALHRKRLAFSVIPGQESPPRYDAIDEIFEDDSVDGVVHVVGNGFIDIRGGAQARKVLVEDIGLSTLDSFRDYHRADELVDLRNTCALVRRAVRKHRRPKWLVVAVTKTDLFYKDVASAEERYSPHGHGDFVETLHELRKDVGRDNFQWASAPVCSWLEDFDWNGDIAESTLKPHQRDHYIAGLELLESYCGD